MRMLATEKLLLSKEVVDSLDSEKMGDIVLALIGNLYSSVS